MVGITFRAKFTSLRHLARQHVATSGKRTIHRRPNACPWTAEGKGDTENTVVDFGKQRKGGIVTREVRGLDTKLALDKESRAVVNATSREDVCITHYGVTK
jgi:hypothetical protein